MSVGRHDLGPDEVVDLVAVVHRRVVAGGHHHPGRRAEVADAEGEDRRGQRSRAAGATGCPRRRARGTCPRRTRRTCAGRRTRPPRRRSIRSGCRSCSHAASPAAARRTSARFMRFGPAPSAPRSPAVPNCRRAPNRSARPSASSCGQHRLELGPGVGVGVLGQPGAGGRLELAAAHTSSDPTRRPDRVASGDAAHNLWTTAASSRPMRSAAATPAAITSAWSSFSPVSPAASVRDEREPEHLRAEVHRREALVHGRHADEVGAEGAGHAHLGRRLVLRPGEAGVHALVQIRIDRAGQVAQPRRPRLGEVDEAGAEVVAVRPGEGRRTREVEVVRDQHALADPVALLHPTGRVGEDDGGAAGQDRGADTRARPWRASAPRTGAHGRGTRAAVGRRTGSSAPCSRGRARSTARTRPARSPARRRRSRRAGRRPGSSPLPSTSATSWRSAPVTSASRAADAAAASKGSTGHLGVQRGQELPERHARAGAGVADHRGGGDRSEPARRGRGPCPACSRRGTRPRRGRPPRSCRPPARPGGPAPRARRRR